MTEGFKKWLMESRGYTKAEVKGMFRAKGWKVKEVKNRK